MRRQVSSLKACCLDSKSRSIVGLCVRMAATMPLSAYCLVTGSGRLAVAKFVDGVETVLFNGTQIAPLSTLFVNGILQATIHDSALTNGSPGLYGQNLVTPDNLIDNLYAGDANWKGLVTTATAHMRPVC